MLAVLANEGNRCGDGTGSTVVEGDEPFNKCCPLRLRNKKMEGDYKDKRCDPELTRTRL